MFGHARPFSYSPRGFQQEDLPQQRRPFSQDDVRGSPPQRNSMFRPSGKSIYIQRKEYSEVLNKQSGNLHVRVEHLFTCELDGQELVTVDDCVAKLKRLDAKGRLWPQEMIMEAQGGHLLLSDIETKAQERQYAPLTASSLKGRPLKPFCRDFLSLTHKAELEVLPLRYILQSSAVLDSCAYNSLLTITVEEHGKKMPQVYMFQCEETGADLIKSDLDNVVQRAGGGVEARRDPPDIRVNLENIIGHHALGGFRQPAPHPVQREWTPPPPDHPPPQWSRREPENMMIQHIYAAQEEVVQRPDPRELQSSPEVLMSAEKMDAERNTEILNHIIDDLEIFMKKVSVAVNKSSGQEDKSKKKKKRKMKKSKEMAVGLPSCEEYISCLQKIKYGFNLLSQLDGFLSSPSAPDFVHIFFSSLSLIVPRYPADVPAAVVSPLLTVKALRLISQAVDPEEDKLWKSLGDSWNVPRSRWPEDVPPYIPEFYDGWQPPAPRPMPSPMPSPPPYERGPVSRSYSQRIPPEQPHPGEPAPWSGNPPAHTGEPPVHVRVIYDFMARNDRELSLMKGDVVQVIQKSKQWWLVRNSRGEEGNVPQNVLEPTQGPRNMEDLPWDTRGPVSLDMSSTSAEVKAWLEYKGFSKITVKTLGVLTGNLLLGMTKDEIRTVCPEEGGKVFFQLQAIKSSIALSSESSGPYGGRY